MEELLERLSCEEYHDGLFGVLRESDGEIFGLIEKEYERLQSTIQLLAAENQCSRAVLAALGSVVQHKTTEGFPGARLHGGSGVVDEIERLATARARELFGAKYANVQPHSGTTANQIVLAALLQKGDKILSMGTSFGGHFSHGSVDSIAGRFFTIEDYHVDRDTFVLNYDRIREQAIKFRPKLIICGASAYTRTIDFAGFRQIADEVGAYLLADISHISALVIAGAHASPVNYAHVTTTSTYKPGGPRGGLIVMGRDYDQPIRAAGRELPLWQHIDRTTFPGVQGTPYLNHIAAKAVFFKEALSEEYKMRQFRVVANAVRLAGELQNAGFDVLTGGTDNHMILVNAANLRKGLTGASAQRCLESCGIVVDRILLPYDEKDLTLTSGIRLGTPIVTRNGMGPEEMSQIAGLIDASLRTAKIADESRCTPDESAREKITAQVKDLCSRFPMR